MSSHLRARSLLLLVTERRPSTVQPRRGASAISGRSQRSRPRVSPASWRIRVISSRRGWSASSRDGINRRMAVSARGHRPRRERHPAARRAPCSASSSAARRAERSEASLQSARAGCARAEAAQRSGLGPSHLLRSPWASWATRKWIRSRTCSTASIRKISSMCRRHSCMPLTRLSWLRADFGLPLFSSTAMPSGREDDHQVPALGVGPAEESARAMGTTSC